MAIVEFTVIPAVEENKINAIVDMAIKIVQDSGLPYEVEANGTTIEGELNQVWEIVRKAHEIAREYGSGRVFTVIKIDDRKGGITMREKVKKFRNE